MVLNVGIIGAGGVSRAHAREYRDNPKTRLYAVAESNGAALEDFSMNFDVKRRFSDYRELLEDDRVDVVDICLPHFLHRSATLDALNAGRDVILEKPIALTLKEADEIIELAERKGRKFFVALNQRFLPAHRKLKELLDGGRCGRPFLALGTIIGDELRRMNIEDNWKGSWELAGGGALADTGTHIVDLMHYFFGTPEAVTCSFGRYVVKHENKGDDNVALTMEYEDMMANIVVTYSAASDKWSERKDVYCTEASLHVVNEAERSLFKIESKGEPEYVGVEHDPNWWEYSVRRCVAHFVDCIAEGGEPAIKAEDARAALRTILIAYESARVGRRMKVGRET
ncbi:MAG: Gfo/Idh/MocA family protein [bacterium]